MGGFNSWISPWWGWEAGRIMVGMDVIHLAVVIALLSLNPDQWPTSRWRWTPHQIHQGVRYRMSFCVGVFQVNKVTHRVRQRSMWHTSHCSTSPRAVYSCQSSLPELVFDAAVSPNYHPQICYTFVGRCCVRPTRLAGDRPLKTLVSLIGRAVCLKRKAVRCPAWGIIHTACAVDLWAVSRTTWEPAHVEVEKGL